MVALTAHAFQEDIQKSREAGCDGHLVKPIKLDGFLRAVRRYARSGASVSAANEIAMGWVDPCLIDLIPGYLEKINSYLALIETALNRDDFATVYSLAHIIKGSGGGYGFDRLK